ncbi:SLC13 family permease [Bythopirellula polymerisocia]|uniref:Sodium-dependent dicarboxylate transporter SdcS n=1 Tax=Bythopirellula polymerisocia TaxID=2528003 RepID=A0A5C6CRF2_9BACT|nr:SLC13 family permease [Bythopirellula polymerisocia]TWU27493.1 Sodium-dependent dicarboxylate transporter SdcS [Bythopirellula polymerisocia]
MTFEAWLTVLVIVGIFYGLLRNIAPPDLLFVMGTALLALAGVITPNEAFAGFSNSGMLTVAFLFVVAAALRETGILNYVGTRLLGGAADDRGVLKRLSLVVIPTSAFLNNTPIVAMLMPVVLDWCRQRQVSPSKLLIPLSYLAILGGTCTLIGTSTNLVVQGLMIQNDIPGMGLFEIGWVGLPYAIVGVTYLWTIGRRLLPERTELLEQLGQSRREYVVEMQVRPGSNIVAKTVDAAGLRRLHGLFLIEIERDEELLSPVSPDETLQANDRLVFAGIISSVVELQKIPGLASVADAAEELSPRELLQRRLAEVVVSADSRLVGRTIRDADFRATYGAAVVAVHRGGSRIDSKIGDIRLQQGDTLLLQTQPHFARAYRNDPAFYLVSEIDDFRPLRHDRAWIALPLLAVLILLMATGIVDTMIASALIAGTMIFTGCISAGEARRSIEWQVLVTIAASFGVGLALEKSGVAATLAGVLVDSTKVMGPLAALACIYVLASILTEMVTNNAIAVLLFPICLETAKLLEVDSRPFLMALALAASASFMTPIGYQTNMMVYGPGGYKFGDYMRVGAPLNLLLGIVAIILVPWVWPF